MLHLDDSIWHEIAKWFAGILAGLASLFMLVLRAWAGDRFKSMNDRLDKHDVDIDDHETRISENHEATQVLITQIDNGKEDRKRIEDSVTELRRENSAGFSAMNERLDKIVERQ